MKRLFDILLYPRAIFRKLDTSKRPLFYAGVFLVGLIDVAFPYITDSASDILGQSSDIRTNILLVIAAAAFLGLIDVLFFSIPLYDLFKIFKKEDNIDIKGNDVRIMKIYLLAHIPVIPVEIILHYSLYSKIDQTTGYFISLAAFIISILTLLWFCGIIARGINAIFRFKSPYSRFVAPIIILWSYILGWVFNYVITNWVMKLFNI